MPQADSARYLDDIKALTTPQMEGRGDGSKGLTRAERLIEKRYKELGLDPAGGRGYAQPFSLITGREAEVGQSFHGGSKRLEENFASRRGFRAV